MLTRLFASVGRRLMLAASFAFLLASPSARAQVAAPFRVYITFEDGPTTTYTPQILDILAQYNAHATFLIAGYQIAGKEDLLQREIREGHAIANHLWIEPGYYAGAPDDDVRQAYLQTEDAIRAALGSELATYDAQTKIFWQPGGGTNPLPAIDGVHVITYNWNVDSDDCGWKLPGVDLDTAEFDQAVLDNVLYTPRSEGQLFNAYDYGDGVIISMHDINRVTARVLPTILTELRQAGATFEALPRPWDSLDTMPVVIGTPPSNEAGIAGLTLPADTMETARLRSVPDFGARTLDIVPGDTALTASARASQGRWIQVTYNGQTGWIFRGLLKVFGPIPDLPGGV